MISKVSLFLLLIAGITGVQAGAQDAKAIEAVITSSYIEPLYQQGDPDKIRDGFHEEFHMYILHQGEFMIRTRDEWIERIKRSRANDPEPRNFSWHFDMIDAQDQTAIVKLSIKENNKLKYVDYLTLYKFEEGWKVITKQFSMY